MMHSGHNSLHSAQQVCLPANLCAIARMVHSGHNSLYIVQSLYSAQQPSWVNRGPGWCMRFRGWSGDSWMREIMLQFSKAVLELVAQGVMPTVPPALRRESH
eukprot:1139442-Pelagomonas_calceolata.AAC.2